MMKPSKNSIEALILRPFWDSLTSPLTFEVSFNFGLVTGKIGSETQTLETREARLQVVEQYIHDTESIGSPSTPAKWIGADLSMSSVDIGQGCLFFVGEGDSWVLALAGSSKHLAGGAAPQSASVPFSFLPDIASLKADRGQTRDARRHPGTTVGGLSRARHTSRRQGVVRSYHVVQRAA